jgi:PhnB protein
MQVNPYLSFNGQCEAAFKLYEQCFGGQLGGIFRYASTSLSGQVPADWQDKVTERFGMVVDRFGIPWLINCEAAEQPAEAPHT